jgi:integrase/recombinase XerD
MKTLLAPRLEAFFTERLYRQLAASQNTVLAYRDTFRLLLRFAQAELSKAPSEILLGELDSQLIGKFLDHLEKKRGNSARSRNARLAAIHSFFKFVTLEEPAHLGQAQRILAIPQKRSDKKIVTFLTRTEAQAMLAAVDRKSWLGRRDYTLLVLALQTGLRVSELLSLRPDQVVLESGPYLRCYGKGRKERCTPLTKDTARVLKEWLKQRNTKPTEPIFATRQGHALSRDAVERLVAKYARLAAANCPSIKKKRVSPHVLRHTAAVDLLQAGVDRCLIALYLGHESVETTQIYLSADLTMKEKALSRVVPLGAKVSRFKPDDRLMAFLEDTGLCRV